MGEARVDAVLLLRVAVLLKADVGELGQVVRNRQLAGAFEAPEQVAVFAIVSVGQHMALGDGTCGHGVERRAGRAGRELLVDLDDARFGFRFEIFAVNDRPRDEGDADGDGQDGYREARGGLAGHGDVELSRGRASRSVADERHDLRSRHAADDQRAKGPQQRRLGEAIELSARAHHHLLTFELRARIERPRFLERACMHGVAE